MVNYAMTRWVSAVGTLEAVMALMETQIETVDNAKTIYVAEVEQLGDNAFQAVLLYVT